MLTYGFYDSINGDRKYNAEQVSRLFDGLIHDGIFANIGEQMMVKTPDVPGMSVLVKPGRAWLKHTWTLNDSPLFLAIEEADVVLNRIDAIVLEVNKSIDRRENTIKVLKGTPASEATKPNLKSTYPVFQYPLAYVSINANVTQITQSMIENCVGTSVLPFVTGVLSSLNADDLIAQWSTQWDDWFKVKRELVDQTIISTVDSVTEWKNSFITEKVAEINQWMETSKVAFDTWYQTIKDTLSGDATGNILAQLANKLNADLSNLEVGELKRKMELYSVVANRDTSISDDFVYILSDDVVLTNGNSITIILSGESEVISSPKIKHKGETIPIKTMLKREIPKHRLNINVPYEFIYLDQVNKVFLVNVQNDKFKIDVTFGINSWVEYTPENLELETHRFKNEILSEDIKSEYIPELKFNKKSLKHATENGATLVETENGKIILYSELKPTVELSGVLELTVGV